MDDKTSSNKNSNSNSEDSMKNDEYLLGYSSQYKTNLYKDEEIEEGIIQSENEPEQNKLNKKISLDSTSISISQEGNNLIELRKGDFPFELYNNQRKMSSPLLDYLKGSYKYLSQIHQKSFDIRYSHNFIRKDKFFGLNKKLNTNNINNNHQNNNDIKKDKNKNNDKNNSKKLSYNSNNTNKNKRNQNPNTQTPNNNNTNNINNYINNNFLLVNNNYSQQVFNNNYINLNDFNNFPRINNNMITKRKMTYNIESSFIGNYFNNILNLNNLLNQTQQNNQNLNPIFFSYNEEPYNNSQNSNKLNNKKNINNPKNKKRPFDKREGDWKCPNCNNLNFAFRFFCNRCSIPKPYKPKEDED